MAAEEEAVIAGIGSLDTDSADASGSGEGSESSSQSSSEVGDVKPQSLVVDDYNSDTDIAQLSFLQDSDQDRRDNGDSNSTSTQTGPVEPRILNLDTTVKDECDEEYAARVRGRIWYVTGSSDIPPVQDPPARTGGRVREGPRAPDRVWEW